LLKLLAHVLVESVGFATADLVGITPLMQRKAAAAAEVAEAAAVAAELIGGGRKEREAPWPSLVSINRPARWNSARDARHGTGSRRQRGLRKKLKREK
jgi:hypothetical protein